MANEKSVEMRLPSLDELFSSQEERDDAKLKRIYEIPLEEIDPFPDHPFKVQDDEDMMNLAESIRTNGILTPATVRKKEDGRYELLSGHRRLRACQIAGIPTLRCEIVEMNLDEATIFMVDANFQRSKILPSEKAFSYKMRLEAMKRLPGRQSKENGVPVGPDFSGRSRELLAADSPDSNTQIQRYIRLTWLIPELLQLVDDGKIALRPAVELSYLNDWEQEDLLNAMDLADATPSHAQAIKMRKFSAENKLTPEVIESIMCEEKPNQKEKINIRYEDARRYIPSSVPYSQTGEFILKALEYYHRHLERQRDDAR